MEAASSLQLPQISGVNCRNLEASRGSKQVKGLGLGWLGRVRLPLLLSNRLSSLPNLDSFRIRSSDGLYRPVFLSSYRRHPFRCHASVASVGQPLTAAASTLLRRSSDLLQGNPIILKLALALGVIIFSMWGLRPLVRHSRNILLRKNDNNWKKSGTYYVTTVYIQPLLLGTSALLILRVLEPALLHAIAAQIVKERFPSNIRSLSTMLAFAYCFLSVIQQAEKYFMESNEPSDAAHVFTGPMIWKNMMGFEFAGNAVYFSVWILLFMELLGFSTQKWLPAGGLGISLLTLASTLARFLYSETFKSFLSSATIHATRSFVVNERIQAKIDGNEVSGPVEDVGWRKTILRGESGEEISIPNHKLSVSVVRNYSRKIHCYIKTRLAIDHSAAPKIENIVADMRKVLENDPRVENRKVFLDNVNPGNQALMISVSCNVKTSHFEEYLPVKEAILLNLLGVITDHGARLAPEIHMVQKI